MTDAAITVDDRDDKPWLVVSLRWTVGDTYTSPIPWAVLVHQEPVNLAEDGWQVRAQVRGRGADAVLASWRTDRDPADGVGEIQLVTATLPDGRVTSAVHLHHDPACSREWGAFDARIEVEIVRYPVGQTGGDPIENYTIVKGRVRAEREVSR